MRKKVIYLTYGNFNGHLTDGGTLSIITLLQRLQDNGLNSSIVLLSSYQGDVGDFISRIKSWASQSSVKRNKNTISFLFKRIPITMYFVNDCSFMSLFKKSDHALLNSVVERLKNILLDHKPDCVFTDQQGIFAIMAGVQCKIPTVIRFSQDPSILNTLSIYKHEYKTYLGSVYVFSLDDAVKLKIKNLFSPNNHDLIPSVNTYQNIYASGRSYDGKKYVTLVDYIQSKGSVIFDCICSQLPEREFLVIDFRGNYDRKKAPRNVKVVPKIRFMRSIYAKTDILIIPTLMHSSCERVAMEAMANGIPVVVSNVDGLREIVADNDLLVPLNEEDRHKRDFEQNPIYHIATFKAFIKSINRLYEDKAYYSMKSDYMRQQFHNRNMINESHINKAIGIIQELAIGGTS